MALSIDIEVVSNTSASTTSEKYFTLQLLALGLKLG